MPDETQRYAGEVQVQISVFAYMGAKQALDWLREQNAVIKSPLLRV